MPRPYGWTDERGNDGSYKGLGQTIDLSNSQWLGGPNNVGNTCEGDPECMQALAESGITSADVASLVGPQYIPPALGITGNWSQGQLPHQISMWVVGGVLLGLVLLLRKV